MAPSSPRPVAYAVGGLAVLGLLGLPGLPGLGDGNGGDPPPSAPTSPQGWQASGSTQAANGTLRRGCHDYSYTYQLHPAYPDYGLNTFLIGPHGAQLGNGAILSGQDGPQGTKTFQICSTNTHPGRFTITGELYYYDYPDTYSGWISPTYFTLKAVKHHRPRHARRSVS